MTEIQSLARGLTILDKFVNTNRSLSITELAAELNIDKSTASRLVKTLVSHGYVQAERGSRRYVLGRRAHAIGWQLYNRVPLREMAHAYLVALAEETGEAAHTAVAFGGRALMIDDVAASGSMLQVVGQPGRMIPLHCTAVGKALLAFAEVPLPDELERWTPHTITDPEQLEAHLETVREQGYALDDEEYEPGIRCLAAPVYDFMGLAIAVIGISGPTVRVTRERVPQLARRIMNAAEALSADLRSFNPPGEVEA
ncbi:MAG: IclR family transcriptional regulator [Anaerolineae bacterium]